MRRGTAWGKAGGRKGEIAGRAVSSQGPPGAQNEVAAGHAEMGTGAMGTIPGRKGNFRLATATLFVLASGHSLSGPKHA